MHLIAPTTTLAIGEVETLEDLRILAEQRRHINALYGPAARKLVEDGKATTKDVAEAYGIDKSTAHVLIKKAAA